MATIVGAIQNADGTPYTLRAKLVPMTAPLSAGAAVTTGVPVFARTTAFGDIKSASGSTALILVGGTYLVELSHTPRFTIDVPDDNGTYQIADIINSADFPGAVQILVTTVQGWDSLGEQRHYANRHVKLSYLEEEGDGQGGWYRFIADSEAEESIPDVRKPDAIGTDEPGRWIKDGV